jgi:ribose transport system substrate-binding protein
MLRKKILSIVPLVLTVLLVVGCATTPTAGPVGDTGGTQQQTQPQDTQEPTVQELTPEEVFAGSEMVVVMPEAAQGWIAAVLFFAERRGQELRDEGIGNFRILTSANVAEQAGQLDELVSQGTDVIVLFPHSDELDFAAQGVVDADIPLFVFNRNVNVDFQTRLLGSNRLIAEGNAAIIADRLDGEGIVAYISIPAVGSTNVERVEPFLEVMSDFPDIELITLTATVFSMEDALTVTTDALTANPHIDAFYVLDDQHGAGVLQAIREAGRTDIRILASIGGAQFFLPEIIEEEHISIYSATFSPTMIIDAIDLAVEYLHGRRDFENITIIPPDFIDRNNAQDFLEPDSPW